MTHRMNPEIKTRWLAALRSGEYAQTKGRLHRAETKLGDHPVGHCYLGVLCELAVADGVIERAEEGGYLTVGLNGRKFGENSLLPREVCEWAGLTSPYGLDTEGFSLPSLNDCGQSFAEIADVIEEHL